MITKYLAAFVISCILIEDAQSQESLNIPYGTSPTINGIVSTNEWSDATEAKIIQGSGAEVNVRVKHDGQSLYFIYQGNLESTARFPEILLDINNEKSADWDANDWWFHASATDCEYQGEQAAAPNMKSGGEMTDTIEIAIPFALIGLQAVTLPTTIGLSLEVTNTFSAWEFWPATASIDAPSTWGNAVLEAPAASVSRSSSRSMRLEWLTDSKLQVSSGNSQIERVEIRDVMGRPVKDVKSNAGVTSMDIDMSGFPSGPYLILVETPNGSSMQKFVRSR
jgi:hypothetical protein